jgi:hypothetical protein
MRDFFNQFYDAVTDWRISMSVSLLTFVLVVFYGLLNDLFLKRPETSIANESIILALVLLVGLPLLSLTRAVRDFRGIRTSKVHQRQDRKPDLPTPFLPSYAFAPKQSKALAQAMAHLVAQAPALTQATQAMAHLVAHAQSKALAQAMAQAQAQALTQATQSKALAQAMAHLVAHAQSKALAQAMAQAQAQALALAIREVGDPVSYLPVSSVLAHIRQGRHLVPSERLLSPWHTSQTHRAPGEIFDPCHIRRVSNQGTGLGLTIAHDISQKHFNQREIEARDAVLHGTISSQAR